MAIDRLSELPESLIHEILSRLPMREVVATMLLSKRWKDLWITVPCLQFHSESDGDDLLRFKRFVSGALALWKGDKILSLSFRFNMDTVDTDLDSWLDFAVKKQVEDLCVDSTCVPYDCPDFVYSCSSLKKLTLNVVTFHVYESVKWNRLKSLTLQRPEPYSEEEMDRIFKGAPLLESLNLTTMENLSNFAIRSKGLKALKIDYIQYDSYFLEAVLTIDAPNLESLEISGIWHTKCSMNVPSLKTAVLGFDNRDNMLLLENLPLRGAKKTFRTAFRSISHVQNLTLNEWSFKLLVNQMKNQFSVLFPNAKSLKLCTREAEGIPLALSIFPALETLDIDHREFGNFLVEQKTSFPSLPLPHLKRVYISWEVLDGSMIGVVKSLIENDRVLDKLELRLMYGNRANQPVYASTAIRVILMIRPSLNPTVILSNIDFLEGCLGH